MLHLKKIRDFNLRTILQITLIYWIEKGNSNIDILQIALNFDDERNEIYFKKYFLK